MSTIAAVAMFGAGFTNTGGSVFAGVQETCIHTVSAKVTWGERKREKERLRKSVSYVCPAFVLMIKNIKFKCLKLLDPTI